MPVAEPNKELADFADKFRGEVVDGWINSALPWFSPKDLQNTFGKSRQYWCKLIKQGKIKAHQTAAGPIITTEQIIDFIDSLCP